MKKEAVMNKSTKQMNKPTERTASYKQRGIVNAGLLITAATLGTAVLVAAMSSPKLPPTAGD